MLRFPSLRHRPFAAGVAIVATIAGGIAVASDHQDSPEVELNPSMDMTDFSAFPSPTAERVVLVLNSRPFLTPGQTSGASFDSKLLDQIKVDNTGDAIERLAGGTVSDRLVQEKFADQVNLVRVAATGRSGLLVFLPTDRSKPIP